MTTALGVAGETIDGGGTPYLLPLALPFWNRL
jgi:hypothetical protein